MENFTNILNNYLSPNNIIRSNAERQLKDFVERGDPNDLDFLFQALHENYDNNVKLFIAILIKKVFDTCINENNRELYKEYISNRKLQIVDTILNINADLKTINFLVIILENCINLFENEQVKEFQKHFNQNFNKISLNPLRPEEIFEYIFNLYNLNKSQGNNQMTFQQLYISFKLLRFLKEWKSKDIIDFAKVLSNFYNKIFLDFEEILQKYIEILEINENENFDPIRIKNSNSPNKCSENFSILTNYIKLYCKIAKHSVNFFVKEQRDKIMNLTFNFLYKTLFYLNTKNISTSDSLHLNVHFDSNIFDCIFLANKILLKYTACFAKLDLITVKNFAEMFYIYISEQRIFQNLMNILKLNMNKLTNKTSNTQKEILGSHKEKKFITDIIDFFKELLQLTSFDNWGDLILFKDCFSEDNVEISDYLNNQFFTIDKVQNLLIFCIKNCMTFSRDEIDMALNEGVEEFYTYYDTMTPQFDLREKAALLCRIIYDKYKKNLKEFHQNLENELVFLTERESQVVNKNLTNTPRLTFDEINLKCGLLYYFEALAYIYSNKNRNWEIWVHTVLLHPLNIELISQPEKEIFSTFIVLRILMKIIDFKEVSELRIEIFKKVYELFVGLGNITANPNKFYKNLPEDKLDLFDLIKLGCADFFFAFFDDMFTRDFPNDFLKNSIQHICEMLKTFSSPDIHNKIIKTTIAILSKFPDEEIEENFPYIFHVLRYLWENNRDIENLNQISNINYGKKTFYHLGNSINSTKQKNQKVKSNLNSISVVRENMIKLIGIFIKKIGIFITFPNSGEVDTNYFEFVYNVIGYSISVKSQESNFLLQESLKLILLIEDEFYRINCVNKNLSPEIQMKPSEFYQYFQFYFRIYDFLPIILYNISTSDEYHLAHFLILEQYLSLISIKEVREFLFSIDILEKLILIVKNSYDRHIFEFSGPIFNFIEFCVYVLNSNLRFLNFTEKAIYVPQLENFNNFVYQLVENIFTNLNNENEKKISNLQNILQKLENDFESESSNKIPNLQELNLLIGALQLSNRLIHVNYFYYNVVNFEFNFKILNYLLWIVQNKIVMDKITVNDKKIVSNLIKNLGKIFSIQNDLGTVEKISELGKLFLEGNSSNFLDRNNHTLNHWLFFFNKMNNDTFFYQLTAMEDLLRHFWTAKLKKLNYFDVDLSNLNFDLKYYSLLCDEMYKEVNVEEEIG